MDFISRFSLPATVIAAALAAALALAGCGGGDAGNETASDSELNRAGDGDGAGDDSIVDAADMSRESFDNLKSMLGDQVERVATQAQTLREAAAKFPEDHVLLDMLAKLDAKVADMRQRHGGLSYPDGVRRLQTEIPAGLAQASEMLNNAQDRLHEVMRASVPGAGGQ